MEFEWNDNKAASNLAKHGVPFELAAKAFHDLHCIEIDATRKRDGETRRKCLGQVDGRLLTVVFTMRRGIYRIVSARRANAQEERAYHGSHDA
jgi:uncharacterized protein